MLSSRLKNITPSFTIGISTKVKEMSNNGINIIDLSIGEPDFNIPNNSKLYGIEAIMNNHTKYDVVPGLNILREEISKKLKDENNCIYSPDEIVVSSGAKHSITNTLLALTDPFDEVLIPKPYWVSYPEMVKINNLIPIFIDTNRDNNFKLTKKLLESYITDKTKILVLNNPSNPTGVIYSKEELLEIVNVCIEKNIYILADEIYERINFNNKFVSVASLSEDAKNITVTINGFSKSAAMTGLRIGYTASNKTIAKAITTIQGHLVSHPSLIPQYIAYGVLKDCKNDISTMVSTYKSRRDLICNKLDSISNLTYIHPDGAFYTFINISGCKDKLNYVDSFSIEFCNRFLEEYNVAIVPGIAFGLDDYIRVSFACNEELFLEGMDRLNKFIDSL